MPHLATLFGLIPEENTAANSLYLPLSPRAKNWPAHTTHIPHEVVIALVEGAFEIMFPFLLKRPGYPESRMDFNAAVADMLLDRNSVIWNKSGITVVRGGKKTTVEARIEYCFAQKLLKRIQMLIDLAGSPEITAYNFLVDLIGQSFRNSASFISEFDEFRSRWLFLRGAAPYRTGSLFSDVTILVQYPGNIVRLVFGESEQDIDEWYRYEWLAPFTRQYHKSRIRPLNGG